MSELVGVRCRYEDGSEFYDYFPKDVADLVVSWVADGWDPAEKGMRVVSAVVEYSKLLHATQMSDEALRALDAIRPNIDIDPKYDRRKPLL